MGNIWKILKRKNVFMEGDISRKEDLLCVEIIEFVCFVVTGVAKK
jgi:hypothetical protein